MEEQEQQQQQQQQHEEQHEEQDELLWLKESTAAVEAAVVVADHTMPLGKEQQQQQQKQQQMALIVEVAKGESDVAKRECSARRASCRHGAMPVPPARRLKAWPVAAPVAVAPSSAATCSVGRGGLTARRSPMRTAASAPDISPCA